MQSSSRAPLLSATFSTDSCWIMSASLLQNFGDTPAGLLRDRASLDDAHAIADPAHVLLVVDLEAPGVADDLLVERMRLEDPDHQEHGLLPLFAHDNAVTNLAARTGCLARVTHRHPPRRRRAGRAPAQAPWTLQRERRRERRPGPRGVRQASPRAARGQASASPPRGERPGPRGSPEADRVRSRCSRSST